MTDRYDAIVTGLGPAGAAAALELVKAGARVLVIDGRGRWPKPCGGCISRRWAGLLDWLEAPGWIWEHPVRTLGLAAPAREPVLWPSDKPGAYLVERARLNDFLAQRVAETGLAVIRAKAEKLSCEGRGISLAAAGKTWRADWLIAADGAQGLCSRTLGLGASSFAYAALAEEKPLARPLLAGKPLDVLIELAGVKKGYGWAFVRGGKLNLGVGSWTAGGKAGEKGLIRAHARLLARLTLEGPVAFRGAVIPCPDRGPRQAARGRACVAGDAAGVADPFLGEGIGPALFTGRLAARAILAGCLYNYNKVLKNGLLREFAHARLLARLIFGFPRLAHCLVRRHPGSLALGFALLRGELTYAALWRAVAQKIIGKQPFLDRQPGSNYIKWLSGGSFG